MQDSLVARGSQRSLHNNQKRNQTVVDLRFLIPLAAEPHCMTQMTSFPEFNDKSGESYVQGMLAGLWSCCKAQSCR